MTRDVEADALAIARGKQETRPGWAAKFRAMMQARGERPEVITDESLVQIWRTGQRIALPYFDGKEAELFFEDEEELLYFADVIRAFLAIDPASRAADTRHVYAYFRDFVDDVGFEWVDPGMAAISEGSEEIWRFVYPVTLGGMESWDVGNRDRLRKYVVIEGNCGWEEEHGILFSWRDGTELVKLSDYDGHATNGHAYDDLSKDSYIYHSLRPEMCTRP